MSWRETMKLKVPALSSDPLALNKIASNGESSVLVAIRPHPETREEEILLTKRTHKVETHKGQVSFPGGYFDDSDADLLVTALRESHEEVGLAPEQVEILGALPPVLTRGDIAIYPWLGAIAAAGALVPNTDEVERILWLPVRRLIEEGLQTVFVELGNGVKVKSPGLTIDGELVWGATAKILESLRGLLL